MQKNGEKKVKSLYREYTFYYSKDLKDYHLNWWKITIEYFLPTLQIKENRQRWQVKDQKRKKAKITNISTKIPKSIKS